VIVPICQRSWMRVRCKLDAPSMQVRCAFVVVCWLVECGFVAGCGGEEGARFLVRVLWFRRPCVRRIVEEVLRGRAQAEQEHHRQRQGVHRTPPGTDDVPERNFQEKCIDVHTKSQAWKGFTPSDQASPCFTCSG